jgi:hypothetical protein
VEGIEEACNLIEDETEYSLMETDGSNLIAIMSELENYGGYCFLTQDQYNKLMAI